MRKSDSQRFTFNNTAYIWGQFALQIEMNSNNIIIQNFDKNLQQKSSCTVNWLNGSVGWNGKSVVIYNL